MRRKIASAVRDIRASEGEAERALRRRESLVESMKPASRSTRTGASRPSRIAGPMRGRVRDVSEGTAGGSKRLIAPICKRGRGSNWQLSNRDPRRGSARSTKCCASARPRSRLRGLKTKASHELPARRCRTAHNYTSPRRILDNVRACGTLSSLV